MADAATRPTLWAALKGLAAAVLASVAVLALAAERRINPYDVQPDEDDHEAREVAGG